MQNVVWCKAFTYYFFKEDKFIRKDDVTKYLALFILMKNIGGIFDRIRYFIVLEKNISYVYSHKYTKIKIISDDYL